MRKYLLIPLLALSLLGCRSTPQDHNQSLAGTVAPDHFTTELDRYVAGDHSKPTRWWLERTVRFNQIGFDKPGVRQRIRNALERYGDVSPETRQLAKRFKQFSVGVLVIDGNVDDAKRLPGGQIRVLFYPADQYGSHPSSLYYSQGEQAVMVAGLDWPQSFFSAALLHELWHALCNKEGRPSATASNDSDLWIGEEVDSHTIEADVLNAATDGRYYRAIGIVINQGNFSSLNSIKTEVTAEQLWQLDEALGLRTVGREITSPLVAQHLFALGLILVKELPAKERREALIGYYRVITRD